VIFIDVKKMFTEDLQCNAQDESIIQCRPLIVCKCIKPQLFQFPNATGNFFHFQAMNKDNEALLNAHEGEKSLKFGPMLLKEPAFRMVSSCPDFFIS
jgi:hypothetical protein